MELITYKNINIKFTKEHKKDQKERKKEQEKACIAYKKESNKIFNKCEGTVNMFVTAATSHAATARTNKNKMTIISQTSTATLPKTQPKICQSVATHKRIKSKTTKITQPNNKHQHTAMLVHDA